MLQRKNLYAFTTAFVMTAGVAAWSQSNPTDITKIVIGQGSTGTSLMPLYVALEEGFFKKAGIDVTSQNLSGGAQAVVTSFNDGSINMVNFSAAEAVGYAGKKLLPGKIFGEITDQTYDVIASREIATIEDIKGKRIGISAPDGGDHIYFLALLRHYGIATDEVTFVTSGNTIARLAAMSSGAIQVTAETIPLRDQSTKVGTILLKSGDSPVQFPDTMFIASNDLIKNHKPLLKAFLAAMSEATAWMRANPDAASADCAKAVGTTAEVCKSSITRNFDRSLTSKYTWSTTYAINVEGIKSALATVATIAPETKNLTLDDIADTSIAGTVP